MYHHIDWEEHWGDISQTSIDNRVVGWHRLYHERERFYSESITEIKNPGSESMYIWYRNVYYEGVSMFHWTDQNQYIQSDKYHLHSGVQKITINQNSHLP